MFTIVSDQTSPEIETSYEENNPTNADIIHINFVSGENINLSAENIEIFNGTLTSFVVNGSNSFSGEIEPADDGEIKAVVTGYTDEAGNVGIPDSASIVSDRTAPQLTINGPAAIYSGNFAEMTYTANEPVSGFDNDDIEVTNGISEGFTNTGDTLFTSNITGAIPGQTFVNINGESFTDMAGNEGLPVDEFVIDILTGTIENPVIKDVKIYPNPAKTLLTVETGESISELNIINALGKVVLQKRFPANTYAPTAQVDVSGLPKGIYFINIMGVRGHLTNARMIKN